MIRRNLVLLNRVFYPPRFFFFGNCERNKILFFLIFVVVCLILALWKYIYKNQAIRLESPGEPLTLILKTTLDKT